MLCPDSRSNVVWRDFVAKATLFRAILLWVACSCIALFGAGGFGFGSWETILMYAVEMVELCSRPLLLRPVVCLW